MTAWAQRNEARIWIILIALAIIRCWIMGLAVPFQLDETGPVWITAGGWGNLLQRSTEFTQSTLYCAILLVVRAVFGLHEWSFRLPSLIASSVSLVLLYKLARRYFDPTGALLVLTLWLYIPINPRLAMMARPYGLAMAAVFLGYLLLFRWLEKPNCSRFAIYSVVVVLPYYLSFMWALIVLAHAIYIVYRLYTGLVLPRLQMVLLPFIWGLLALPLVPQMLEISKIAALHNVPIIVQSRDLLAVFVPTAIAICHPAAWVTTRFLGAEQSEHSAFPREGIVLCLATIVCFSVPLYLLTKFVQIDLWTPMYLAGISGAFAILHTAILRSLGPSVSRVAGIAAMGFLVFPSAWSVTTPAYVISPVNYRLISAMLNDQAEVPGTALVMTSEFEDGFHVQFPVDEYEQVELLAQLSMYPVNAPIRLVPYRPDQARPEYFAKLNADLARYKRVVFFSSSESVWFGKAFKTGYRRTILPSGGRQLVIYERIE